MILPSELIQGSEPRNEKELLEKEECVRNFSRSRMIDFSKPMLSFKSQKYLPQDVMTTDGIWRVPAKDIQLLISQSIVECSYSEVHRVLVLVIKGSGNKQMNILDLPLIIYVTLGKICDL